MVQNMSRRLDHVDVNITRWLARHSLTFLRLGMGVVFLWFGALKFFPSLSPAEDLALRTINLLTWGLLPANVSLPVLASLESLIGLGFLTGKYMRLTLALLAFQMAGALSPLVLFPGEVFYQLPLAPTMEGQYILKNLVLIGAGLVIGATVRGGRLVAEPNESGDARAQVHRRPQSI